MVHRQRHTTFHKLFQSPPFLTASHVLSPHILLYFQGSDVTLRALFSGLVWNLADLVLDVRLRLAWIPKSVVLGIHRGDFGYRVEINVDLPGELIMQDQLERQASVALPA